LSTSASTAEKKGEFIPLDYFRLALQRWWMVAAGVILGGLLGLGIHLLVKPVYQAQAVITSGIDLPRAGILNDVEEDFLIRNVGDLIGSDAVIDVVIKKAEDEDIALDRQAFDEMRYLQRRFTDWLLIVRSPDAQQAARIANLWADAAWEALSEAANHLAAYDALQTALDEQLACQEMQVSPGAGPVCTLGTFADMESQIRQTLDAMQAEQLAANGLVNGVVFNLSAYARVPAVPQAFGRGKLALAGGLIGLLAGCLLVFTWKPGHRAK
jgi:hypothetical protein